MFQNKRIPVNIGDVFTERAMSGINFCSRFFHPRHPKRSISGNHWTVTNICQLGELPHVELRIFKTKSKRIVALDTLEKQEHYYKLSLQKYEVSP